MTCALALGECLAGGTTAKHSPSAKHTYAPTQNAPANGGGIIAIAYAISG